MPFSTKPKSTSKKPFSFTNTELILLLLLISFGALLRFYNFPNRINFSPESAILSLTAAALKDKFTLLGNLYFRYTQTGLQLFHGPHFIYAYYPLLQLFNFQILPLTASFTILNLLTSFILYLIAKRLSSSQLIAFLTLFLFLSSAHMINLSLFIWDLNYFPLLGTLSLFSLFQIKNQQHPTLHSLLLGIYSGFGLSYDYLFAIPIIIIFFLIIKFSLNKPQATLFYLLGSFLSSLPTIIFDLRHNFYNLITLLQYTKETLLNPHQSSLHLYHFLWAWPIIFFFTALFLYRFTKKHPLLLFSLLLTYLFINLTSPLISFTKAIGMPKDLTLKKQQQVAQLIAADQPNNFNIASLVDFDTRAYPLRFLLTYNHQLTPAPIENYSFNQIDILYVLAPPDRDLTNLNVWELLAFAPTNTEIIATIKPHFILYRLHHQP